MHIPEGYKLVPVDLLYRVVCLDNSFRRHRQAQHDLVTFLAAPVPPQVEAQPVEWQRKSKMEDGRWFHLPGDNVNEAKSLGYEVRPLFTHSDAGEVEKLRKSLDRAKKLLCVCVDCGGQGDVYSGHSTYQGYNQPPEPDMDACGTCDGDGFIAAIEDFESVAKERDTLRAQLAELSHRAGDVVEGFDGEDLPGSMTMRIRKLKSALSATKEG